MRGRIAAVAAAAVLAAPAAAEPVQTRLRLGYGVFSGVQLAEELASILVVVASAGGTGFETSSYVGPFHLAVDREFSQRWAAGLGYAFQRIDKRVLAYGSPVGTVHDDYHCLLAEGFVRYLNTGAFHLYSGLGAGIGYGRASGSAPGVKDSSAVFPAFHLWLLGASYGESWGAFADLGFGWLGTINAGLFARF